MAPADAAAAPAAEAPNPFIGLRPFDIDDADRFFGRNPQTYELLRRLQTLHFVAVIGPSGCGKSSLIRAGVLAALRNGYLAEDGDWTIAMLEPGADPLASWTRGLTPYLKPAQAPDALLTDPAGALDTSGGPMVILVDQFEDLFRYGIRSNKADDVTRFVGAMLATGRPDARIYLILTMRSEYLAQCAHYAELAAAINEGLYLVPRMDREQMRQAIVGQVRQGGGAITTGLVERLLNDAAVEEDSLPVLQHALTQMWPRARRQRWEPMGVELYPAEGGLAAFVDQHAEAVYAGLEKPELKDAAQSLFRAITEMTVDDRPVRRPMPFDAIVTETGQPAGRLNAVIDAFRREGFVKDEGAVRTIDITHEAVARQWKRLGQEFFEAVADRKVRREGWMIVEARRRRAAAAVHDATKDWVRNGRDKAYLFRGIRLRRLTNDLGGERTFTGVSGEFMEASRRNDRWDRLFSREVMGWTLAAVVVGGALALGFGWLRASNAKLQLEASAANVQAATATVKAASETAKADVAVILARAADNDKLKAETAYRQAREPTDAAAAPLTTSALPTKARLFTQIWNDDQRRQIEPILAKLPKADIDVARLERVTVGPSHDELRYFRQADESEARRVASWLSANDLTLRLSYVAGFETSARIRPRHYELWLASPQQRPVVQAKPGSQPTEAGLPTAAHALPAPAGGVQTVAAPALDPKAQAPVIDSVLATASEDTAAGQPGSLSLRIMGQWLDADAQVRIDDAPLGRKGAVVSVLAPASSAKFATDLNLTLPGVVIDAARLHTVTLTNGNGLSVKAPFQLEHLITNRGPEKYPKAKPD
jgi:Novel STAND NTPase 1